MERNGSAISCDERLCERRRSSRYVTVYDLDHAGVSAVCHEIEDLRLHARRLHRGPFQIVGLEFGVGSCLGLLGD